MILKQKFVATGAATLAALALLPLAAGAASSDLLFGQQHSYTVTMRGNGEAVVLARLVFTNTADKPQNTFTFTIPGSAAPSDLVGYQQQFQQVCNYGGPLTSTPLKSPGASGATVLPTVFPCIYATPDYTQALADQNVDYQKLAFTSQGNNQYQTKLPTPVPAQQTTSVLLSYSSTAYAHRSFGAYSFNFQTIKVNQRISSADVAVNVDSDQYLEGKSSVNYQPAPATSALSSGAAPNATALNQISDNLGQGGEIDKSASDLAPGDTLAVKGRYASSMLLLHLPGLLATLGFLVLVAVVILVFWRRIRIHLRRARNSAHEAAASAPSEGKPAPAVRPAAQFANAGNVLAGLVSALGVTGVTWFISWYSQSSSYNSGDTFTSGLVFITAILAFVLFGLGPSVYLAATSRDWRRLVFAIVFEVIFLVAFVLIYAVGIAPLLNPPNQATPVDPGIYNGAN